MKVKIYPSKDQTVEQAEEQLEKALRTKRKAKDEQYAKESYRDEHLDEFHDHVMQKHEDVLSNIFSEVQGLLKSKLGVR
jgi:type I restriction-modification system DNA methylase subunit